MFTLFFQMFHDRYLFLVWWRPYPRNTRDSTIFNDNVFLSRSLANTETKKKEDKPNKCNDCQTFALSPQFTLVVKFPKRKFLRVVLHANTKTLTSWWLWFSQFVGFVCSLEAVFIVSTTMILRDGRNMPQVCRNYIPQEQTFLHLC